MRTSNLAALLIFVLFPALGCEAGAPPSGGSEGTQVAETVETGRLVIVGGGLQSENTPVYEAILDGRLGSDPLCVIPTASGTPERSMEGYVSTFDELGGPGTARGILLTVEEPARADSEAVAAQLKSCSGFFFTGGSQSRITTVLRPQGEATAAFEAIWERFMAGAVVAGSSAGAAIMTDPMIAGGGSLEALQMGIRSEEEDAEGVLIEPGLGFLEIGFIDQHFLARGRWGRLLVAILDSGGDGLGFGIDENTALVVNGDSARVVGESGVIFMDARSFSGEGGDTLSRQARVFLLGNGDVVSLDNGEVAWDSAKEDLPATDRPFDLRAPDLFDDMALLEVLHQLALARDAEASFVQDGYRIEVREGSDFQALAGEGEGVAGTPWGLSMGPFLLNVQRE